MNRMLHWAPAAVLMLAGVATAGVGARGEVPLREPLAEAVPHTLADYRGRDVPLSEEEQRVAGMTEYVVRLYQPTEGAGRTAFSLYVGYYGSQTQGRTIHSPKNCLPGAGWEALASRRVTVATAGAAMVVNQYVLQRGDDRALVLYWYQGRGRVEANEYAVKWDLLRDALIRGRSEEALVRIMVPITGTEEEAFEVAAGVATTMASVMDRTLPT